MLSATSSQVRGTVKNDFCVCRVSIEGRKYGANTSSRLTSKHFRKGLYYPFDISVMCKTHLQGRDLFFEKCLAKEKPGRRWDPSSLSEDLKLGILRFCSNGK